MILRIRTKDDLSTLLRHGNSPAWNVAEWRIEKIESVEIYQFDGKKVLKGKFERDNSFRNKNGRLVVAFTNAAIEDSNFVWNGQNSIKYVSNEYESIDDNNHSGEVGIYTGLIIDGDQVEECYSQNERPDIIVMGTFDKNSGFVGQIQTNWCDKYPTDHLIIEGKSAIDSGGFAEDEDGVNLWNLVNDRFPLLQAKIEDYYEYFEMDEDEEHRNISQDIPEASRLSALFKGFTIDLSNIKDGSGSYLGIIINLD